MRIQTTETVNKVGEEVLLKGWVNARRNMSKIVFFPDAINVLTEPLSKKIKGSMMHTAIMELMNKSVIGDTVESIF